MRASGGQSERFLTDVVREFDDEIEYDRAEYFRQELKNCNEACTPECAWNKWCAWQDLDEKVGQVLAKYGDIRDTLENIIAEQEELDKEAQEDYQEKQQAYREMQGC